MQTETLLRTQERIEELVGNLDSIATLPDVTARITQTVNDPRSTPADLHRIISHDPALVARLLRVVNSAFYARSRQIDSVERAIVLLGFQSVRNLAIAATLGQLFKGGHICEGFTGRDLWNHCIAVAVVARQMAKINGDPLAEEVFLAGLVHDVGLLVELQVCRGKLRQVCERAKREPTPFSMIELEVIGVDHQELGAALARKWGFPESCAVAAAHHHHPSLADEAWQKLVALVQVADTLCCKHQVGFHLTASTQAPDEAAFKGLVPMAVIEETDEKLPEIVGPALGLFA
jgi:putative nucleotidyltransferase with HDIG domain